MTRYASTSHFSNRPFLATAAPALPARSKSVALKAVPCPEVDTCGAQIGEACKNANGEDYNAGVHTSRRRMATRLHNANLGIVV